jgi:glycosyltransferase involved in cell wall biosynthesis
LTGGMISVVVLSRNEAINIARCLESVAWSDDVLVIDSGSTDGTPQLAAKMGARVMHRSFDSFAGQRNFALDQGALRHEWVLHLDCDEVVSPQLRGEMESIAREGNGKPGYRVPSRLMLMGTWLKHSGMYPSYQVRFGSRDKLRFHMVGHGQRELLDPAEVGTLKGDLIHYNFSKGISDWLAKHARYARDEAAAALDGKAGYRWSDLLHVRDEVERRRILKELSRTIPLRPLARFMYVYFFRLGFLDGRAGLRYAMLIATYQWAIDMNIAEQRAAGKEGKS